MPAMKTKSTRGSTDTNKAKRLGLNSLENQSRCYGKERRTHFNFSGLAPSSSFYLFFLRIFHLAHSVFDYRNRR